MTDDENEDKLYFSPEQNNVIFASAVDGWGFGYVSGRKLGFWIRQPWSSIVRPWSKVMCCSSSIVHMLYMLQG